ncbi:MAG: uroporphyrinogen-III synthase [Arenicellales bacterium]|nr:uroporphyrinogen-III synthase [Arenicellales bacterium]
MSDLKGISVLVTRPAHQSERLASLITSSGGGVVLLPTIEIAKPPEAQELDHLLSHLEGFDLALFVSQNAVEQGLLRLKGRPLPATVAAVGRATARALEVNGVAVSIVPEKQADSESLLAHPELQNVEGKKVVIFRGVGGRMLITETLAARGAGVTHAICYQRIIPDIDPGEVLAELVKGRISLVVVTSVEAVNNLFKMVGREGALLLSQCSYIAMSDRVKEACQLLGCGREILVPQVQDDAGIMEAIGFWHQHYFGITEN